MPSWPEHVMWWHVYPLGFVGAPIRDGEGPDAEIVHRLGRLDPWLDHVIELGLNGLLLGRCSRRRPTATTPSTTCASTRDSATTAISTGCSRGLGSAASACCSTGFQPRRARAPRVPDRDRGRSAAVPRAVGRRTVRGRGVRGARRARRPRPLVAGGRRPRGRRDVPLARARDRRVETGCRVRGAAGVLGRGASAGAREVSRGVVRRRGHPRGRPPRSCAPRRWTR